ncbi:beta-N-acetylglucosaminidase domain-containing protein, partial [Prevotellamassilia timonensis]|uniref:beta-N-acetylglucosaminidase domain-containing protein n=1 Tax=Prevotellamassilia timonensis TaxID=1852370 RepID=UPI0030778236
SATVVDDVMKKFGSMYDLGFRQFAIFADDVNVPGDEATMKKTADNVGAIQHAIEDKWNIAGADPADTVKALRFTPQIYCRAFAGPDSQFNSFFQAMSSLPANVTVYYTGGGVWSVPNNNDLNTLQAQFGRQAIWWWNYPCNDNGTGPSEIYPLDMKSNFVDMPNVGGGSIASELTASNQGILCNPMEQGDASKTAIFSAGDYCWNNKGFDNMKSWEASFKGVLPGNESAQKAYRFLAPYLSKNDPESLNTLISDYKKSGDATALNALMDEIVSNCEVMLALETAGTESEQLLLTDIKPWVVRLRDMAITTKTFLTCNSMSNAEEAWSTYMGTSKKAAALSTDAAYMTKHMSGFGSDGISTSERLTHASYRYLTPFVTGYLNAHAVDNFFAKGNSVSVFTNNAANADKASVRGGSSNLYIMSTSALEMADGEYVGIALANPTRLTAINVKSSLADTYEVLYSLDGKVWNKVEADGAAPEGYVHYVVLVNKSGEKQTQRFRANVFSIDLATSAEVAGASAPATNYWQDHNATYLYDGNYSTYTCLNREQQVNDVYQINLKKAVNIENVRICMGTTNGDNAKKALVQISEDNSKWTSLNVAGTKSVEYGIDLPQNKVVATADGADVIATDFIPTDASGRFKPTKARYVRFKLTEIPSGNKWLRLNEIEVNGKPANELTAMQDESGIKIGNATDGDASTSTSVYTLTTASGGEFVYNLLNAAYVKAVTFFCTPETVDGLKFAVTNDGTTWDDLAAESNNGVVKVSLGEDQRAAKAIKIVWTGKTVPVIHEVAETAVDTDTPPVVDGIEQVTAGTTTGAPIMTLANGIVTAQSALGLAKAEAFTADGRCIFSQSLGGVKQAVIPVAAGGQQMVIVKVTLVDGTAETVKAIIK